MATAPPRENDNGGAGIQIGYGGLKFRAQGLSLILALGILLNLGVTIWAARVLRQDFYLAHAQRAAEHQEIVNELARSACINALTPEERAQFRAGRGGWSRWCWWVKDEPAEGRYPRGDHDDRR